MDSTSTTSTAVATSLFTREADSNDQVPAHHANPVVAFIIGLAIILLASILNAAGLNLTKLDHVSAAVAYLLRTTSQVVSRCAQAKSQKPHEEKIG